MSLGNATGKPVGLYCTAQGQPELDTTLNQPAIRQLRQRITFSYQLKPMARRGLENYVNHRLQIAGHIGRPLFDRRALDLLYSGSRGVPRLVNILAHKALMAGFGHGIASIGRRQLRDAITDTVDARTTQRWTGVWALPGLRWIEQRI